MEGRKERKRKTYKRGDKVFFLIPEYTDDKTLNFINSLINISAEVFQMCRDKANYGELLKEYIKEHEQKFHKGDRKDE